MSIRPPPVRSLYSQSRQKRRLSLGSCHHIRPFPDVDLTSVACRPRPFLQAVGHAPQPATSVPVPRPLPGPACTRLVIRARGSPVHVWGVVPLCRQLWNHQVLASACSPHIRFLWTCLRGPRLLCPQQSLPLAWPVWSHWTNSTGVALTSSTTANSASSVCSPRPALWEPPVPPFRARRTLELACDLGVPVLSALSPILPASRRLHPSVSSTLHSRARHFLALVAAQGGLIILENPASSLLWLDPSVRAWLSVHAPFCTHVAACQFSMSLPKAWAFWCNYDVLSPREANATPMLSVCPGRAHSA